MNKKLELCYTCSNCDAKFASWTGLCVRCKKWGTIQEKKTKASNLKTRTQVIANEENTVKSITSIPTNTINKYSTNIFEFDRVLGEGLMPGSLILITGEPGVGKSTLILDIASKIALSNKKVLYISAEESESQVALRAKRINALQDNLLLASETDLGAILGYVENIKPRLLILDSIQTIASKEIDSPIGGVAQVNEVVNSMIDISKRNNIATILVGHVTKDGSMAGPRTIEHLVDVVCQFEGDKRNTFRIIRATKNRYGPTDEIGCFELDEKGIKALEDPSNFFISSAHKNVPGTCVTVTLEGRRALLVEVQALVVRKNSSQPYRISNGLDNARCGMLLAVIQKYANFPLMNYDSYFATVGGVKLSEPAVDLSIILSLYSSYTNIVIPEKTIVLGEVGLSGEIRQVPNLTKRLKEAVRIGFKKAIVPIYTKNSSEERLIEGMEIKYVRTINEALCIFNQ